MPYRIVDWNIHFENNRTREMKSMDWVPMKNRMDGYGYVELVDHPNGAAHFGAWVAIVEIASRCPIRGTLMALTGKGETPHTPASLARISRIPAAIFEEALPRLAAIGWIEHSEAVTQETAPGPSPKNKGKSQVPAQRGTTTPQDPAEHDRGTPQETAPGLDSIPQDPAALREYARAHSLNGTERKERNGTEYGAREKIRDSQDSAPAAAETIAGLCEQYFYGERGKPDGAIVQKIIAALGDTSEERLLSFRDWLEIKRDTKFVPKSWGIFPTWAQEVARNGR